ncbi:putative phosphatidylinositol-glycan biosynthesis class S protein [Plasmopara halstedii]
MAGTRLQIVGTFVLFVLLAAPVAWLLTQVERVELPVSRIQQLSWAASRFKTPPDTFYVDIYSFGSVSSPPPSSSITSIVYVPHSMHLSTEQKQMLQFGLNNGPQATDDALKTLVTQDSKHFSIFLIGDENAASASPILTVGKYRHAWSLDSQLLEGGAVHIALEKLIRTHVYPQDDMERDNQNTKSQLARRALRYRLQFSLLKENPLTPWNENLQMLVDMYLSHFVRKVGALANFTVETQVIQYARLAKEVTSNSDGTEFHINANDLKHFKSTNDYLDASVLDDGEQVLHFMAALPDVQHAPLFIRPEEDNANLATAFELPGWGIVVILNPFKLDSTSSMTTRMYELQRVMGLFITEFRTLLGVPSFFHRQQQENAANGLPRQQLLFLPSSVDGIADWELDVIMRERFTMLMQTAIETLQSTLKLVETLPELSVLERVQVRVQKAVTRLEAILCDQKWQHECVEPSDLHTLLAMARQASELTDAAYYDHTMIRQLYFPQEQMLGVYAPLLAPLILPFLLGLIREIKRYKAKKREIVQTRTFICQINSNRALDILTISSYTPVMASKDSLFDSSLDELPAFFSNGSVDDTKYESLLADLRAHDLLGPIESSAQASDTGSSIFFNDAFSAIFMGTFQSKHVTKTDVESSRAPPGLGAPSEDLKWARGQQLFSRLEEKFQGSGGEKTGANERAPPPGLSLDQDTELDESQVPGLKGLGLDDDDTAFEPPVQAPPPLPHPPPIPMSPTQPPNAYGLQSVPSNTQQQQYLPSPPHMQHRPPHPVYIQGHQSMPSQGLHPPPPHYYGRGPPPPLRPPFVGPPGTFGRSGVHQPLPQLHSFSFKMMTPRDVNFVMQQQMKWLRSSDPFSDDYYFHNYMQKRNRGTGAGHASVPLPSWKLQHVKSVDPRDAQREVKSRNWENEYHVLGRNTKSSLYRPKQLLNLANKDISTLSQAPSNINDPECTASRVDSSDAVSSAAESSSEAASSKHLRGSSPGALVVAAEAQAAKVLKMSENASRNSVFANDTWTLRLQLDRGMQCLLSLQDARHLLDARGINVQQFHSMCEDEMDIALVELRSRTTLLLLELAALLGVNVTHNAKESEPHGVMNCDLKQLQKMLMVSKGKILVSRALPLLHPSARFVLLPHVVTYLLSGITNGGSYQDNDDRLCQTLVLLLLYVPPSPPLELLVECLQRALDSHNVQSLSLVLHNRARAEAFQALLQRGALAIQELKADDMKVEHVNAIKEEWEYHQNVFVQMATAMKQTN